jgi:large subunit ribosomal protein L15
LTPTHITHPEEYPQEGHTDTIYLHSSNNNMFFPLARRLQTTLLRKAASASSAVSVSSVRPLATAAAASSSNEADNRQVVTFLRLNNLQDNPGAIKQKRRIGRGVGSGRGKTSTRGHKGQKARSGGNVHPSFEGGQTKFYKLLPKRGFNNARHAAEMLPINLGTLQMYIDMGRIDPNKPITMRELMEAGLFKANAVQNGVKLLSNGKERLTSPVTISISRASAQAIDALEAIGGQVTTVHYNRLALRQLLRPQKFADAPVKLARPPPKWQSYYSSWSKRGYLNPAVQMRAWLSRGDSKRPELQSQFDEIMAALGNKSDADVASDNDESSSDTASKDKKP